MNLKSRLHLLRPYIVVVAIEFRKCMNISYHKIAFIGAYNLTKKQAIMSDMNKHSYAVVE